jgi:AraC family transcriptional regulator
MTERSTPHRAFYERRIARVLAYIGEHLTEELSVERLSDVAGFSKFHFHRQFTAFTGVSVARAISLMRLKHASMQLAFDDGHSITDVAFDAGFETPESFSRAFKKLQGQSPSEFRSAPEWETWVDIFRTNLHTHQEIMEPKIVTLPETRIAVLEHRGAPQELMKSVQRFIEWRKSCDVSPNATSRTYGIAYDDPDATEPAAFRFDICGSISDSYGALPKNDFGIIEKSIPKGRYVVARHLGSTDVIGKTVYALYGEWIPKSGEELRDFPCFFHYIDRMPTVSEHEQVTDVYLPLK